MDLREKKTQRAIRQAFLELRARKPLERITVKELAERAEISKATFYLHYRDIYDLSDTLQRELIREIVAASPGPAGFAGDPGGCMRALFSGFAARQAIVDTLFSGTQAPMLPAAIEHAIKEALFAAEPAAARDARLNTLLTYHIQGAFCAYTANRGAFPTRVVLQTLDEVSAAVARLFGGENK